MPRVLFLAFMSGLLIAGIMMRRVVRTTFARGLTIDPDGRQSIQSTNVASERREPNFVTHRVDHGTRVAGQRASGQRSPRSTRKTLAISRPATGVR
jgi:hypothetical protein